MESPLFQKLTDPITLTAAFASVRSRSGAPGGDGQTVEAFAFALPQRIARLSDDLRRGLYHPGPLRLVPIPKKAGGTRMLSIPCVVDRVAQRAAKDVLEPVLDPEFEDESHGYRAGRGVHTAVARVGVLRRQGYTHVVDGDIRAFFDSIPHPILLNKLAALVTEPRLLSLVALWLAGFSDQGRGLAQGSPLSPLLANLFLDSLDEAFLDGPVRIVRFADDFVLLARTRGAAEQALVQAEALLTAHGLEMNREKTRIVPFEGALHFLGHLFVRSLMVRQEPASAAPDTGLPLVAARSVLVPPAESDPADTAPPQPRTAPPVAVPLIVAPPSVIPADAPEEPVPVDLAPGRAPLYVLEPGRRLEARGEAFAVTEDGRDLVVLPAHTVLRIDLGPDVEAIDAALRLAAAHDIPVVFLDGRWQPTAVLYPRSGDDAGLQMAQAGLSLDPDRALAHARILVAGRIGNARVLLIRLNRRADRASVRTATAAMGRLRDRTKGPLPDIDAARGLEGAAARLYWPALGALLRHGFHLPRRREDPDSPVTAILNWTASLLARETRAAVLRAGLHPGFGVLHAARDDRDAGVFDLMEEFRAPLAEGLTVYLFNNRILRADDFIAEADGVRVVSEAGRRVIREWEAWLARPITLPGTRRRTTWRGLMLVQAQGLGHAARSGAAYRPYAMDH